MLKIGAKVKYRDLVGEVMSVMEDMAIVKLPDGKEYSLPLSAITLNEVSNTIPGDMSGIMAALKPHIKNVTFLNELAKVMSSSGINELHIKSGAIQAFSAKESLEERIERYKTEAILAAEEKARSDHEKE